MRGDRANQTRQRDVISISDPRPTAAAFVIAAIVVLLVIWPGLGTRGPTPPELDGVFKFVGRGIVAAGAVFVLIGLPSLVRYGTEGCSTCSYDLSGNRGDICPECGTKIVSTSRVHRKLVWRPLRSVIGIVLLILGLLFAAGLIRPWGGAYAWWVAEQGRGNYVDSMLALKATRSDADAQRAVWNRISAELLSSPEEHRHLYTPFLDLHQDLHPETQQRVLTDHFTLELHEASSELVLTVSRRFEIRLTMTEVMMHDLQVTALDITAEPTRGLVVPSLPHSRRSDSFAIVTSTGESIRPQAGFLLTGVIYLRYMQDDHSFDTPVWELTDIDRDSIVIQQPFRLTWPDATVWPPAEPGPEAQD